jgi:hypothetical protein
MHAETKLWRNPEAHRIVVAQIIDYAKDLAKMTFEDFCQSAMKSKSGDSIKKFFRRVKEKKHSINEVKLQQDLQDSLPNGRFLLIIVGDEIFPQVALLTESISSAPHLEFSIALSELRFYRCEDEKDHQLLVVPQIVGESKPQVRAVVRILYEGKKPEAIATPLEIEGGGLLNEETFKQTLDLEGQELFSEILKLSETEGFPIRWGVAGFSLNANLAGKNVPIFYGYGNKAWFGQSLYTSFSDILRKVENGREIVLTFREKLLRINAFNDAGKELAFKFKKKLSIEQTVELVRTISELGKTIESSESKIE